MPRLSLRTLASLFIGVLLLGILVIVVLGASVAYLGPLLFFSSAAIGTVALLFGGGTGGAGS